MKIPLDEMKVGQKITLKKETVNGPYSFTGKVIIYQDKLFISQGSLPDIRGYSIDEKFHKFWDEIILN